MVYPSSNEEGLAFDPMVYPSSYEEGRTSSPVVLGLLDPPHRTGMNEVKEQIK